MLKSTALCLIIPKMLKEKVAIRLKKLKTIDYSFFQFLVGINF